MRKLYWYFTAYLKKHGTVFIVSLALALIVFSFIIPSIITTIEKSNRHYIGIVGDYTLNNLPQEIKEQLSAGLTQIEPDGSVSPLLAQRWTVEQEGTTYRFLLKEGLTWQDGTAVTPDSIHYQLQDVETIITPNDIVFKLPDTFAPFPSQVAEPLFKPGIIKKNFLVSKPTLIGISNYSINDYATQGDRLIEMIVDGENERYIYRFYLTEKDAISAFKRGEVDKIANLAKEYDVFEWNSVSVSTEINYDQYLAIFFDINNPKYSKNVRQALYYSIQKPEGEKRAVGPINPDSWAYLPGGKGYELDLERASDRMLDSIPPEPLAISLTTTTLFENQAERIKEQWEQFGNLAYDNCQTADIVEDKTQCENLKISVAVRITNFPDTSNFEALLIGQQSPPDPDQYYLWHSEQSTNFTGYKNTRIDKLLESGRQTIDQKERTEIYQEFQQFFLEDSPAIFIEYLESYTIERN